MKALHIVTFLLLVIGWLNWWLVGVFGFNLVSFLLGDFSMLSRVVYSLVWFSAIVELFMHPKFCKMCGKGN